MKQKMQFTTSRAERLSVGLYAFGTILSYYMIMSFLQLYMTDIGISAVAVGIIFMFAKVWDAVNDPIFGVMVDKVNLKGGKYRPWLRISSIAIPVTTILLFIVPAGVSVQVKIIWSSVAYILWDTAYTMCDVPMNAIVTAMTESTFERNKMYSLNAFFVYLGGILVAIAVPMLYPMMGWGTTAIIFGVLCMIGMFIFRFPYATMIGTLVGFTALVPIAGAYIGAVVGAFMILTVSPLQAALFVVYLTVLQQLEGNLIYPRVVGTSLGLPGMWVLAAVTVGGGLYGILGMLIGVPLAAAAYRLLKEDVSRREGNGGQSHRKKRHHSQRKSPREAGEQQKNTAVSGGQKKKPPKQQSLNN